MKNFMPIYFAFLEGNSLQYTKISTADFYSENICISGLDAALIPTA